MHLIKHSAILPYSATQMFELVNAIEDYPHFLPWCKSAHIVEREENTVTATVEVSKGGVHKTFTTHNTSIPYKAITIELVQGPFDHLLGAWQFNALNETACSIDFTLDFKFKNKLSSLLLTPLFSYIGNTMIDAFTKRAIEVYGEN
jgi:ribosome-associated toxin RatA of RatAB toxin-antitoxin module